MLPSEPSILLSVINTKLRDEYSSLEALADGMDEDASDIKAKLLEAGYVYNEELNQFKSR